MRTVHKKYAVFYCASFGTTLIATMLLISKISRKVNNVLSRDLFFCVKNVLSNKLTNISFLLLLKNGTFDLTQSHWTGAVCIPIILINFLACEFLLQ